MLRVALDVASLSDDDSATRGFGRYVRSLLDGVATDPTIDLVPLNDASSGGGPAPFARRIARVSRLAARADADVFHQPTAEPPLRSAAPYVQTLHDVIPLVVPDPGFTAERRRWRYRAWAMRRADLVIAISRWAATAGTEHLGLDPDRIRVVHHGVDPGFVPSDREPSSEPPYLLFVGEPGPHKGLAEACAVIDRLAAGGRPHELRIVGNVNARARADVARLLADSPRVRHLGRISDHELRAQYQGATALLFTSRSEGFGLPPIEAMACATPVFAFANTSIPEVVGDGGVLVADGDVPALAKEVERMLASRHRRTELAALGLHRVRSAFTLADSAAATVDVYREASRCR